jgi:hypothetical protein
MASSLLQSLILWCNSSHLWEGQAQWLMILMSGENFSHRVSPSREWIWLLHLSAIFKLRALKWWTQQEQAVSIMRLADSTISHLLSLEPLRPNQWCRVSSSSHQTCMLLRQWILSPLTWWWASTMVEPLALTNSFPRQLAAATVISYTSHLPLHSNRHNKTATWLQLVNFNISSSNHTSTSSKYYKITFYSNMIIIIIQIIINYNPHEDFGALVL